ncbi:MoaD/ThiS family protein [Mycobacterium sp.]|uniref:MoaD/ThiS family protein n=1 Tax=Mycobacterium sp. TaxID=1785 RepID=UPI0031D0A343
MTRASDTPAAIRVTVRYFAAARAAAGVESETIAVTSGATVAELVDNLAVRDPRLAAVLKRCSYLRDGVAVRDDAVPLRTGDTVDVLPPFAGG